MVRASWLLCATLLQVTMRAGIVLEQVAVSSILYLECLYSKTNPYFNPPSITGEQRRVNLPRSELSRKKRRRAASAANGPAPVVAVAAAPSMYVKLMNVSGYLGYSVIQGYCYLSYYLLVMHLLVDVDLAGKQPAHLVSAPSAAAAPSVAAPSAAAAAALHVPIAAAAVLAALPAAATAAAPSMYVR